MSSAKSVHSFTHVDAQLQVDFIGYLQRLLVEGDFVATY